MKLYILFLCALIIMSCSRDEKVDKSKLLGKDYRLFQDTPAWDLAKAVWDEDVEEIKRIVQEDKESTNYKEPRFGNTLLMLAVVNEQYNSVRALLESGADPNMHDSHNGSSAIIDACRENMDAKFLKLLLTHGANPNDVEVGKRQEGNTLRNTPLLAACKTNLEKVKMLVEAGANINYRTEYGTTPLKVSIVQDKYDIALYLLEKGADYRSVTSSVKGKDYYLWDELRFAVMPLNSEEHKHKMKIVDFLRKKGIDYRQVPIPEYVVEEAKKMYPDGWQEYLQKY